MIRTSPTDFIANAPLSSKSTLGALLKANLPRDYEGHAQRRDGMKQLNELECAHVLGGADGAPSQTDWRNEVERQFEALKRLLEEQRKRER